MDSLQTTATSVAVIAIVVLMVVFVCHYLGPRATAWVRSNREEKIGLSKSKIFNANGYMIHSGSDFLLSSTGSFKRFDSIDRDYKQVGQSSLTSPAWNIPQTDIPPQPLRPAPAPAQVSTKLKDTMEGPIKQKSSDAEQLISTVIPRPVTKRQFSSPIRMGNASSGDSTINMSEVADKIRNSSRANTNPFLNGTLNSLSNNLDNPENCDIGPISMGRQDELGQEVKALMHSNKNPFTADCVQIIKHNQEKLSLREQPKTDIDKRHIFDFEPERISSILENRTPSCDKEEVPQSQSVLNETKTNTNTNRYLDSECADAFENIEKMLIRHYRNRSFSETEATESDLQNFSKKAEYLKFGSTNPFVDKDSSIHKTFSEDYLAKNNNNQTWSFGRSLSRQESCSSLVRRNSSHSSLEGDKGSIDNISLQRAVSCDSVSSESSVVLADLEQPVPPVTGYLCIGLQYDRNSITDEGVELVVTVMEAKELIGPPNIETFDTFVRIYLVPDEIGAMQTKLFKNSSSPSYNETFCFWLNKKRGRHSLWFHLYHSGSAHTLIGEAEMQICDVSRPITTWLALCDSRHNSANWGELMFSLSYLPTAERLTVVVVKARSLKLDQDGRDSIDLQNIFVKVYLLKNDKKVSKKKTSLKRADRCPIFNESMIFSIPPFVLSTVQVRLTVMSVSDTEILPIGHVIVGANTGGKGVRHWHQMLSSLRKPVAMWHALRRTANRSKSDIT